MTPANASSRSASTPATRATRQPERARPGSPAAPSCPRPVPRAPPAPDPRPHGPRRGAGPPLGRLHDAAALPAARRQPPCRPDRALDEQSGSVHGEVVVRHAGLQSIRAQHTYCRACRAPAAWTRPPDRGRPLRSRHNHCALAITDDASPLALRSIRNRLRRALHRGAVASGLRRHYGAGIHAIADHVGVPCQKFARDCATRSSALSHHPTLGSIPHLRGCAGT